MDTIGAAVVIVGDRDLKPVVVIESNFMPLRDLGSFKFPVVRVDGIADTLTRGLGLNKGAKNDKSNE
jgi:hypothetical protein